jgi:hypothetical protein
MVFHPAGVNQKGSALRDWLFTEAQKRTSWKRPSKDATLAAEAQGFWEDYGDRPEGSIPVVADIVMVSRIKSFSNVTTALEKLEWSAASPNHKRSHHHLQDSLCHLNPIPIILRCISDVRHASRRCDSFVSLCSLSSPLHTTMRNIYWKVCALANMCSSAFKLINLYYLKR